MNFYENDLISIYLSDLNELEKIESSKQIIQLFDHPILGKVLVINGELQHIENFQCLYHEMLVHLPISFHQYPERALIIGGGSLFAAYEILKYSSIITLDLCDFDPCVIYLMEKYYFHAKSVINDKRFNYINNDARDYIENTKNKYDIIINDCFNIIKETASNNTLFCDILLNMLNQEGICSDIIYRHIFDKNTIHPTINKLKSYSNVCFSLVTVPEYPGVLHLEALWGKNKVLYQEMKTCCNMEQINKLSFDYYNPKMMAFYLYLPPYLKKLLKNEL